MNRYGIELSWSVIWDVGLETAVRATVILGLAAIATRCLSRQTAALRHLVWSAGILGVLLLPVASALLPELRVLPPWREVEPAGMRLLEDLVVMPKPTFESPQVPDRLPPASALLAGPQADVKADAADNAAVVPAVSPNPDQAAASFRFPWRETALAVWALGSLVCLVPLFAGSWSLILLRRSARSLSFDLERQLRDLASEAGVRRPVLGLVSDACRVPLTWGWLRPVVMLPSDATTWSASRRRLVLLHELAHVRRGDYVTQLTGQLVRAGHWFNPLAWWSLARLRVEQEQACDDSVLNAGTQPEEYATELLSLTTRLPRECFWANTTVALAMGRAERLERRLATILNPNCERRPLTATRVAISLGAATAACLLIAVLQQGVVQAQNALPPDTTIPAKDLLTTTPAPAANKELQEPQEPPKKEEQKEEPPAQDDRLQQAIQTIEQLSAHPVDNARLREAAIRGMLQALNDPYSDVIGPDQMREFQQQMAGSMAGIGAALKMDGPRLVIHQVLPGSPAMATKLAIGDEILQIDGEAVTDLATAVKKIRGQAGTTVNLVVRRGDQTELKVAIQRGEVRFPVVRGVTLTPEGTWRFWLDAPRKLAYVQLAGFHQRTANELEAALRTLAENGMRGLVLDLRGSPGGMFDELIQVAQLFLKNQSLVQLQVRQEAPQPPVTTGSEAPFADLPLILLIDDQTASAAEVLAAALQDHGRAVLLGERTFGKGSVQSVVPLGGSGEAIKLTTAQMLRVTGQPLGRLPGAASWGVDPDDGYYVPLTREQRLAQREKQRDHQSRAVELPEPWNAREIEQTCHDPQLAAAHTALAGKLKTGEFAKSGRPRADMKGDLERLEQLRQQRAELVKRIEALNRELGPGN